MTTKASRPIIFPFSGFDIGGSHIATFELAKAMRSHFNRDCRFLAPRESRIFEEAQRLGFVGLDNGESSVARKSGRARRSPVFALKRLPARYGIMKRLGPGTIIHCNEINGLQAYGVIARAIGAKVVYHHHALNRMVVPNTTLLRSANAVLAVSQGCHDSLDFLPPGKVHTVVNPIEMPEARRDAGRARIRDLFNIPSDTALIGFSGNFWQRKRPKFFLEVAAQIIRRKVEAHFIIFGRPGDIDQSELENFVQTLELANRTTFAGFCLPAEDNIAALDLLMAPALNEPFGRTLIEAALLRVPYVATRDAGHAEIGVRWGGGRLVDRHASAIEFADAAVNVLCNPASVTLPDLQLKEVRDQFSAKRHAETVTDIYSRL